MNTCPRCKKPVIEVRDFGPAGALYIHGYSEHTLGKQTITAPDGCRLTAEEVANGASWTHQSQGICR